jgi:hypothetical protein
MKIFDWDSDEKIFETLNLAKVFKKDRIYKIVYSAVATHSDILDEHKHFFDCFVLFTKDADELDVIWKLTRRVDRFEPKWGDIRIIFFHEIGGRDLLKKFKI